MRFINSIVDGVSFESEMVWNPLRHYMGWLIQHLCITDTNVTVDMDMAVKGKANSMRAPHGARIVRRNKPPVDLFRAYGDYQSYGC